MKFWVIYQPGVGGHGFSNLLEHADNVNPIDDCIEWRIHYRPGRYGILDRPIKFYPGQVVDKSLTKFESDEIHTVLSSHPNYDLFKDLSLSNYNILIHLYSSNVERVISDFNAKMGYSLSGNFKTVYNSTCRTMLLMPRFSLHLDIELAWRDWNYCRDNLQNIGISLNKKYYDQYLEYIDL